MRGRLSLEECTAKLGGLNMTPARAARCRPHRSHRLRHGAARRHGRRISDRTARQHSDRSRIRQRISPPQHADDRDTLVFAISQSGETADTLGALRESRRKGYRTLGICNNVASTIARESDGGVYMHAGPEIGVAATKSFHLAAGDSYADRLAARPDAPSFHRGRKPDDRSARGAARPNRRLF